MSVCDEKSMWWKNFKSISHASKRRILSMKHVIQRVETKLDVFQLKEGEISAKIMTSSCFAPHPFSIQSSSFIVQSELLRSSWLAFLSSRESTRYIEHSPMVTNYQNYFVRHSITRTPVHDSQEKVYSKNHYSVYLNLAIAFFVWGFTKRILVTTEGGVTNDYECHY